MPDGKAIISGWADGKIRAFTPQTGKLKFEIVNAHNKVCTSLRSVISIIDQPSRLTNNLVGTGSNRSHCV
jgi:hypothetical protein